jgi:hypothetical protein
MRGNMAQIKIFKGLESNLEGLEKQVNAWLDDSRIKVLQAFGNMAPQTLPSDTRITSTLGQPQHVSSDVFLVFLYERNDR